MESGPRGPETKTRTPGGFFLIHDKSFKGEKSTSEKEGKVKDRILSEEKTINLYSTFDRNLFMDESVYHN